VRRIPQLQASAPQQRKRNRLINAPQRGNVSKACKIVCQEMIPACSDDTVQKLRDLHPARSLNLNLENLPTPESLNAFWDGEEGTALRNKIFSVTEVRKYFRTFQALGATDIDGWRGREHVLYLFTNNDTELHQLMIDELIFLYVMGEFLPLSARTCGGPFICVSEERWRSSPSSVWVNLAPMRS
jgi:hypothetical protein